MIVIIAMLTIESGARLYYALRSVGTNLASAHEYWLDDPDTGYRLKPLYVSDGVRINSLGFRGPEVAFSKPPGTQRIVAIGDSTTFGPHESECAYPYLLPDVLAPRRIESINAGIEGYRSDRALVHLKRDVTPLHPDLVTVFVGWNDLYQTDPRVDVDSFSLQLSPLQRVLAWSAAAQGLRRVYFEHLQPDQGLLTIDEPGQSRFVQAYRPREYAARLRAMIQTVRGAGADVVLLTWPTILDPAMTAAAVARVHFPYYTRDLAALKELYNEYQLALRQIAEAERVPLIDIAAPFEGRDKATLFKDTVHFSCEGHALVANAAAAQIGARLDARSP